MYSKQVTCSLVYTNGSLKDFKIGQKQILTYVRPLLCNY